MWNANIYGTWKDTIWSDTRWKTTRITFGRWPLCLDKQKVLASTVSALFTSRVTPHQPSDWIVCLCKCFLEFLLHSNHYWADSVRDYHDRWVRIGKDFGILSDRVFSLSVIPLEYFGFWQGSTDLNSLTRPIEPVIRGRVGAALHGFWVRMGEISVLAAVFAVIGYFRIPVCD